MEISAPLIHARFHCGQMVQAVSLSVFASKLGLPGSVDPQAADFYRPRHEGQGLHIHIRAYRLEQSAYKSWIQSMNNAALFLRDFNRLFPNEGKRPG